LLRGVDVDDRRDLEVLAPLREKERELDGEIELARARAAQSVEAAKQEAQSLRERMRQNLAAEIDGLRRARALALDERRAAHRLEVERQVAALRQAAATRRDAALALIYSRVIEGAT
jgi:vacuolar-type H+-ATPase subunit H